MASSPQGANSCSRSPCARPLSPTLQWARPTHFVAIRLISREILRRIQQFQQRFVAKDPLFDRCLVPLKRLHTALLLTSIEEHRVGQARLAFNEAAQSIRAFLGGEPVRLVVSGLGTFGSRVIHARVQSEPPELLEAMHHLLSRTFMRHGFPILDETGQSWLEAGEEPRQFSGHASVLKVTKAIAHARSDEERRALKSLQVTDENLASCRNTCFGTQLCLDFEFLEMMGSASDGYYPRVLVESLPRGLTRSAGDAARTEPKMSLQERGARCGDPSSQVARGQPELSRMNKLADLGLDVWQTATSTLVLAELLCFATVSRGTLAIVQAVVRKVKVMLFSVGGGRVPSSWEGSCCDWDRCRGETGDWPLELRCVEQFLSQPAGEELLSEMGFLEEAQQELFSQSFQGLQTALRKALPRALGAGFSIDVVAVRNLSALVPAVRQTLRAAQPEIVGIEGVSASELASWCSFVRDLTHARVLVHAWTDRDVDCTRSFPALLAALPARVRGLDFQNLGCPLSSFPTNCLPKSCVAFGTIPLQRDASGGSARGSMDFGDFLATFPRFPDHVGILRLSLGTEGHWAFSAEAIADVLWAKFPGMRVIQLELALRPSAATNDVPFVDLARALVEQGLRVEVTNIRCRAVQYEFLRAALQNAGAAVHQPEEEPSEQNCVFPFSHPRFDWTAAGVV